MSNLRPFVISALLLGLIAIGIISTGIMIASENDATQSIANDTAISNYATALQNSLANASESASSADASFRNSTVSVTGGVVFVDAIGGLWKTLTTVPSAVLTLTTNLIKGKIMGDTAFYAVFGVMALIIVITLILAVWKAVSTGESG